MAAPVLTVIDAAQVIPARGAVNLNITVKRDGVALNLTGKAVNITLRKEDSPDAIINASLEDAPCTHQDATNGLTRLVMTNAMTILLVGGQRVTDVVTYVGTILVVEDDYVPQLIRLYVSKVTT